MTTTQKVISIQQQNPEWGQRRIAKALGLSRIRVRQILDGAKLGDHQSSPAAKSKPSEVEVDLGKKTGIATSVSRNIRTLDDLLAYADVDLKVWEVERFVVNKWEVGAKDAKDQVQVTPLFQCKAWLKRKVAGATESLTGLLGVLSKTAPKLKKCRYANRSGNALELAIVDPHHGKLAWGKETGESYDLKISTRLQEEAVAYLLDTAAPFKPEQILMAVGNDYFHTDNTSGSTTAGTPQDCDVRWQKQFTEGVRSMIDGVLLARKVAPVQIIIVPGNHDTMTAFCLGSVLAARFHNVPDVHVNNEPMMRKYWQWGKCLLGLTHGNNEKVASLPLIMATEVKDQWAATKFREIHIGHFHKKMEVSFKSADEFNGIRYRVLPSLTPADAWHKMHGYAAIRAAEAFVLNKEKGFIGNFSFTPN